MSGYICPICNSAIAPYDRSCTTCGVDLALAARTTEQAILRKETRTQIQLHQPVAPEILVPRLGEHLVEQGKLTASQLKKALVFQAELAEQGERILVGQALIHLGFINQNELDAAITRQIFLLQDALLRTNQELEDRVSERTTDLQKALKQLSELSQLKSNFVSNISHELRTPLTHIKGYAEMLRDHSLGAISSEQGQALAIMVRSIDRLETLIDDLIHFSKTSQDEVDIKLNTVSAAYILEPLFEKTLDKLKKDNLEIKLHIEDNLPDIICDQEKITWVLRHLLENAVKFTPGGGEVCLSAVRMEDKVRISVTDTGIGIADDQKDEIFEAFHQLDTSTTRKFGGTGLGLALVKRILHAHQTEIFVRSTPGKGSTFYFQLETKSYTENAR